MSVRKVPQATPLLPTVINITIKIVGLVACKKWLQMQVCGRRTHPARFREIGAHSSVSVVRVERGTGANSTFVWPIPTINPSSATNICIRRCENNATQLTHNGPEILMGMSARHGTTPRLPSRPDPSRPEIVPKLHRFPTALLLAHAHLSTCKTTSHGLLEQLPNAFLTEQI